VNLQLQLSRSIDLAEKGMIYYLPIMHKLSLKFILLLGVLAWVNAQSSLVLRSEYEAPGDSLFDFSAVRAGSSYTLRSGNEAGYYALDGQSGVLRVAQSIADVMGVVQADTLEVEIDGISQQVIVVDAFDYFIQENSQYSVLSEHQQTYLDAQNEYTAYNNLWGKGSAVPNVDFRMATLHKNTLPDSVVFIWDTPGPAADWGGSSVWSYISILWGNRLGIREDLEDFPFAIESLPALSLDFAFEKIYGSENYKIALNHFLTDESGLEAFAANDGDFFLVFDQVGTWVPPYPVDLGDTLFDGHSYARLYKEEAGYEWRRVIIRDEERWLNGTLDLHALYHFFAENGALNVAQFVPNIQVGIEVTEGFGAVRVNHLGFSRTAEITTLAPNPLLLPSQALPHNKGIIVYNKGEELELSSYANSSHWILRNNMGRVLAKGRKKGK
jgi:hypothetical protein